MLFFGVQCRCSEYQVESYIIYIKKQEWKRKREAFVKVLEIVKLVLVNIRFRLDISMLIMVTNPGIGFGA